MCTITFIPLLKEEKGFVVTSNRDESANRKTLPPKVVEEKGVKLLYPKDEVAGGTWIGASGKKRLICLMNGAFKPHQRKESYTTSRGVVVKEFLLADDVLNKSESYNFEGIEPFTMIMIVWKAGLEVYELIWDETKVYFNKLENEPHIWSASMTYDEEMKKAREEWFKDFLEEKSTEVEDPDVMWDFHQNTKKEDKNLGLIIDRGLLKTTSITQLIYSENRVEMRYRDLLKNKDYKEYF
ncbi:NRDE family protein [Mesonia maritima]|uniref:Transport and Golgi organization protein 2 n=1 Tax=Mesonia maritima TaxID=1793873 RepID=A0ABU1K6P9_9FLAO|nr:NRDE family protein [Mesonia maritima]MDR6301278.1 hypothetical protein [Mesonia maritima]